MEKIANTFLQFAKEERLSLTNMQLQKLVFLGQGYSLALLDRPVYDHPTYAWQWGPVIPKLYKALQKYGSGPVVEPIPLPPDDTSVIAEDEFEVLRAVWNGYKRYTGSQLSEITHRAGTPWSKTWEIDKFGMIPNEQIQAYYRDRLSSRS